MIYPVILCGGSGTRLWPLSRKSYPKQFTALVGDETLFQMTVKRFAGGGFADPVIVTNDDFRFIATEQISEIGTTPESILIEPEAKNTAPAILAAALKLRAIDPEAVMLVAPSDHLITDVSAFRKAVGVGEVAAQAGNIVTFGITPTRPETGYGYLEVADDSHSDGVATLQAFVEKPNLEQATEMLASGSYLWNAGLFLSSVTTIVEAFESYADEYLEPVTQSLQNAEKDLHFLRLEKAAWQEAPSNSIDFAVMEHAQNLKVVPFSGQWSDVGGWDALWREGDADEHGVVKSERATSIECRDSLLRSESEGQEIVGIGLKNTIAVAMPDAVLVADMSHAQDVKKAVEELKAKGVSQAVSSSRDHRPWGWFESLVVGERFQVKRIVVHPGATLSLQSHVHRAEHWIVVEGTALVTIGKEETLVSENQSVYVPLGEIHRLHNPGKVPVMIIEVQTGAYVGEDDIIRYEDVYKRD